LERKKTVVFYSDKCVDCGVCITACKYHAITSSS
jgi:NAD-dependent dihydropyrimidine dehydrogenase PreA subunit